MTCIPRHWVALLLPLACATHALALSGGPLSGRVVDASTGKPVADAIVVVHWNGSWTKFFGAWSRSGARAGRKNEHRLWEAMAGEAEALAETPDQRAHARMLRKFTEESLVNLDKPNGISESGRLQNIDPHDRLKVEEVPR